MSIHSSCPCCDHRHHAGNSRGPRRDAVGRSRRSGSKWLRSAETQAIPCLEIVCFLFNLTPLKILSMDRISFWDLTLNKRGVAKIFSSVYGRLGNMGRSLQAGLWGRADSLTAWPRRPMHRSSARNSLNAEAHGFRVFSSLRALGCGSNFKPPEIGPVGVLVNSMAGTSF